MSVYMCLLYLSKSEKYNMAPNKYWTWPSTNPIRSLCGSVPAEKPDAADFFFQHQFKDHTVILEASSRIVKLVEIIWSSQNIWEWQCVDTTRMVSVNMVRSVWINMSMSSVNWIYLIRTRSAIQDFAGALKSSGPANLLSVLTHIAKMVEIKTKSMNSKKKLMDLSNM